MLLPCPLHAQDVKDGEVLVRIETALGNIDIARRREARADHRGELPQVRGRQVLRRRAVPPRHPAGQLHARAARQAGDGDHPGAHQPGAPPRGIRSDPARAHQRHRPEARRRHDLDGARAAGRHRAIRLLHLPRRPAVARFRRQAVRRRHRGAQRSAASSKAWTSSVASSSSRPTTRPRPPMGKQTLLPPVTITRIAARPVGAHGT